jgi:hypothetical protein
VVQFHSPPLVLAQLAQCPRQPQQLFVAVGLLRRRRLLGGQPALQAHHRLGQGRLQGPLQADGAGPGRVAAQRPPQGVSQDLPQPGSELGLGLTAELVALLVRLEQGLLHQVGRVELALQADVQLRRDEHAQVVPVALQRPRPGRLRHANPILFRMRSAARGRATGRGLFKILLPSSNSGTAAF